MLRCDIYLTSLCGALKIMAKRIAASINIGLEERRHLSTRDRMTWLRPRERLQLRTKKKPRLRPRKNPGLRSRRKRLGPEQKKPVPRLSKRLGPEPKKRPG